MRRKSKPRGLQPELPWDEPFEGTESDDSVPFIAQETEQRPVAQLASKKKKRGYTLGGMSFLSKKEIQQHAYNNILRWYPRGERVNERDSEFLLDLLLRFDDEQQTTIGCGIDHWEVNQNPRFPQQNSIYIVRADRSRTDFSYSKCLQPQTALQKFNEAARQAVGPQIIDFKRSCFRCRRNFRQMLQDVVQCPATGKLISYEEADVDHAEPYPFKRLINDFINQEGIDIGEVEYAPDPTDIGHMFKCPLLKGKWEEYHRKHAKLRVICKIENRVNIPHKLREREKHV